MSKPSGGRFALHWAAGWFLFVAGAYLIPNDAFAAFTIFPAWTWTPFAILPLLVKFRRYGRKTFGSFLAAGFILFLLTTEEWRSLIRWTGERPANAVRVITLNCASLTSSAQEVIPFRPDVVLLTENPGRPACEALARKLFGDKGQAVVGPDGAILAQGPLMPIPTPRGTHDFTAATASVGGVSVGLVALRLNPPEFNVELYNPEAWRAVANNRRGRREELAGIAGWVAAHPEVRLMAGDYNAQPWDPSLHAMPEGFADAFRTAGTGWGHTAVNDYPLARIDQIWTRGWRPHRMWVVKTVNSDHRMVVADFNPPEAVLP